LNLQAFGFLHPTRTAPECRLDVLFAAPAAGLPPVGVAVTVDGDTVGPNTRTAVADTPTGVPLFPALSFVLGADCGTIPFREFVRHASPPFVVAGAGFEPAIFGL
jgi:hypothetical protein